MHLPSTFALIVFAVAMTAAPEARQFPGFPAQRPAPTGTGTIVGRVVDGQTTRPLAGVVVAITPAPSGLGSMQAGDAIPMDQLMSVDIASLLTGVRQVLTDAQGRFAFAKLPKGTFQLAATKSGWSGGNYGQHRPDGTPLPFNLAEGEQATSVQLDLWKNGTLSGTVVDEAGDPIVNVGVRALRLGWTAGHARYTLAGSAQTDDRGMYRISGLRTGDYLIAIPQTPVTSPAGSSGASTMDLAAMQSLMSNAAGNDPNTLLATIAAMSGSRSSAGIRDGNWVLQTSSIVAPVVTAGSRMLAYRTTFFPAAVVSTQGTPVAIVPGEERAGIDFQLRPGPVFRIAGVVTGPSGGVAQTQVRLVPVAGDDAAPESGFETATTTTAGDGAFVFLGVPAGQYTIRVTRTPPPTAPGAGALAAMMDPTVIQNASGGMTMSAGGPMNFGALLTAMSSSSTEPTLWASQPVAIGESDVTGVSIVLRPAFRISGRAEFEGASKKPTPEELRRLLISVERADVGNASPIPSPAIGNNQGGRFDANGQFTTAGVLPGRYFVRMPFSYGSWTLKSAMLNGRDVSDVPVDIDNADVSGVVLTFTDQRAELSGTVRDPRGDAAPQASVVVFPTQPEAWTDFGSAPRRLRVIKSDATGGYRLPGLPAGSYFVAAVNGDVGTDWQNPQTLDGWSRSAARVTIGDAEKRTLDLRLSR